MKLAQFVNHNSFATLITYATHLGVSHLNLLCDETDESVLYGHLSRANPQCEAFTAGTKAVAIFSQDVISCDAHHAAYVYGELYVIDELEEKKRILDRLVQHNEEHRPNPWHVRWDDRRYVLQLDAIVCLAFRITRFNIQQFHQVLPIRSTNTWQEKQEVQSTPIIPVASLLHIPTFFCEDDAEKLWRFVDHHPLALVVMYSPERFYVRHINLTRQLESTNLSGEMLVLDNLMPHETTQAFIIVTGPHCYVSPRFYQAAANVPTWNYTAVYIEGLIDLFLNAGDDSKAIVQFDTTRIFGKFKLSQNRKPEDKAQIIEHLSGSEAENDQAVAECML
ncbi:MAG: hypothetical protein CK424_09025 [Legionella sp.]|nr:MAG: hypothetical protein CK424_09025 [Legionella sp.]